MKHSIIILIIVIKTTLIFSQTIKEISFGSQIWMAENLNVSKFRNGDLIPQAKTLEQWVSAGSNKQPAWCYYDNDPANGLKFGKLYNWYAVIDKRGLAPEGWHVAGDGDWALLINYLGGENIAGNELKTSNTWYQNKDEAVFYGGYRDNIGYFRDINVSAYWWSSVKYNTHSTFNAWTRSINSDNSEINIENYNKKSGFSVRCVKNKNYSSYAGNTSLVNNNKFEEVIIGKQTWMVKNLNTAKFSNGDEIFHAKTNYEWELAGNSRMPAWRYYDNDPENGKKYGKLYNWYAVNDPRGLAPEGWHIPSAKEWEVLIKYLGETDVGIKLKAVGNWKAYEDNSSIYDSEPIKSNNQSGFSALAAGSCGSSGFTNIGEDGYWWSTTENFIYYAWSFSLSYFSNNIGSNYETGMSWGLSVRCVKD